MNIIKVSTKSYPKSVAGAVAANIRMNTPVCLQAIGARAVNQAVKAVAIARSYIQQDNLSIACYPSFITVDSENGPLAAIQLTVERETSEDIQ